MKFKQGKDREQLEFFCLDQAVSQDNEVRLIEFFTSYVLLRGVGDETKLRAQNSKSVHGVFSYFQIRSNESRLNRLYLSKNRFEFKLDDGF